MGYETINFIYLSEMLELPVVDARSGRVMGRVIDLAATTGQVYPKITGILVRARGRRQPVYLPWSSIQRPEGKKFIALDPLPDSTEQTPSAAENEILLKKSFLDKQIISTSGNKVVRVNDLQLLIDNSSKQTPSLWLVHIDIGAKGLLRRMGWARTGNAAFKWIVGRDIKDKFVSWKNVQPTSTTSVSGSLHLKTDSSKLEEIHPADLADILEDLGTDERISLIESLDHATAAQTLQEMPLKIRVQIAEMIETGKMASIVNEMQMDETVDLLEEISQEKRNALFNVLPPDKIAEIRELSKLSTHSVGSIMNTDFITARSNHTVEQVLRTVREESRKAEFLYYTYIVDDQDVLKGVVTLRHLLSSEPSMLMVDLMAENVITVQVDANIKKVARIFFKYNFGAIPVVDEEHRIRGIITLRDTLESVFPEIREESKG